jgi:hypothetical protein
MSDLRFHDDRSGLRFGGQYIRFDISFHVNASHNDKKILKIFLQCDADMHWAYIPRKHRPFHSDRP